MGKKFVENKGNGRAEIVGRNKHFVTNVSNVMERICLYKCCNDVSYHLGLNMRLFITKICFILSRVNSTK